MIQTFSACEILTAGFGPRDQLRAKSAEGCRTRLIHHRRGETGQRGQRDRNSEQRQIVRDIADDKLNAQRATRYFIDVAGVGQRHEVDLLQPPQMRKHRDHQGDDRNPRRRRAQEPQPLGMNERGDPDRADHGQHPVFGHQRQRAGEAEPQPGAHAAFLERMQIGQHQKRQGHELQQIRIVLEALEIEDRIERQHHHDEEGAAAIDHAQARSASRSPARSQASPSPARKWTSWRPETS